MESIRNLTEHAGLRDGLMRFKALLYCLVHPFDGFYECKFRGLKSSFLAILGIVLYGVMANVKYQYTGFIVNTNPIHRMNSITNFIAAVSVLVLFIIGNWTITTLFNGKGSLTDILMVIGYGLYPVIGMELMTVILSNFLTLDEMMLLRAFSMLIWGWAFLVMLAGLITVHEYTLGQTILTLVATAISMIIIVFIFVLYLTLMQQIVSFAMVVGREAIRRIL